MRAAGHADLSTTQGYIREAEGFGSGYGEVFGPLPEELLGPESPDDLPERYGANGHAYGIIKETEVGEAGFEPATTSTQSSCTTGLCDSPVGSACATTAPSLVEASGLGKPPSRSWGYRLSTK